MFVTNGLGMDFKYFFTNRKRSLRKLQFLTRTNEVAGEGLVFIYRTVTYNFALVEGNRFVYGNFFTALFVRVRNTTIFFFN